jgi:DMSO/TMAO reductase YedYZ molybdopterin-dependent catalytic subunit
MAFGNDDHDGNQESRDQRSSLNEKYHGLEVLSADPENAQTNSRSNLASYLTSREQHYIRNHYRTPEIDADDWCVSLTGMVDEEIDLSIGELKHDFPTESVIHMMECSGNGRAYFDPDAEGDQWTYGAVGNAVWTGTPVRELLAEYGGATDEGLWLSAMGGEVIDDEDVFCRSIPMSKILDDCLLAYEMNGSPLSPEHGYPVRLLVPGWFGNNSVKWVDRIHTMDQMVAGEIWQSADGRDYTTYQQSSYRIVPAQDDTPKRYSSIEEFSTYDQLRATDEIRNAYLFDQLVKSLIVLPEDDATIAASSANRVAITGVGWSGDDPVKRIEVSVDGGETWNDAEFVGPNLGPYAAQKFRYVWAPEPGTHRLLSRATDEKERTQPATISDPDEELQGIKDDEFPWNQKGYANDAYEPLGVTVTVEN